ncbi:hypothetical protein V8D89_009468 [Ganoderma adspersum]
MYGPWNGSLDRNSYKDSTYMRGFVTFLFVLAFEDGATYTVPSQISHPVLFCSSSLGSVWYNCSYTGGNIFFLGTLKMRIIAGFANGLTARTGFKRTNSMINLLIIYAINRGTLTAWKAPFNSLNAQKSMGHDRSHVIEFGTQILNDLNTPISGPDGNS